jgi:hypothetical protein
VSGALRACHLALSCGTTARALRRACVHQRVVSSAAEPVCSPIRSQLSHTCRAGRDRGRAVGRAASSDPPARPRGSGARRPFRRRRRAGRAAGAAAGVAAWPMPWTRPAAPAPRPAATAACSGRRSLGRPGAATGPGRWRRSAAGTSRGRGRPGRPAGRTAAGRARRALAPTTAAGGRGEWWACGPAVRRCAARHVRRTPPEPRAAPREQDPHLGCDQRSSPFHPQGWGQVRPEGVRRTVRGARRAVVSARHHQCGGSYPQYPHPCPQVGQITADLLTWPLARAAKRSRRSP